MTQKDYIKLAAVLRAEREAARSEAVGLRDPRAVRAATQAVTSLTEAIADVLANDSPRFDRERFYAAAGLRGTEMRQS